MKRALTIAAIMVAVVTSGSLVNAQGIEGGVINTADRSITVLEGIDDGLSMLVGVSSYVSTEKEVGRLIVVDPYGRVKEVKGQFIDRKKVLIKAPENSIDKVIYLDRYGKIVGGVGLDKSDAISLIFRNKETFGKVYSSYSSLVSLLEDDNLFDAIKSGVGAFDSDYSEEIQEKYFRSTIYMMAGKEAMSLVDKIVMVADEIEHINLFSRSSGSFSPITSGISELCFEETGNLNNVDSYASGGTGDNGGFGIYASGGTGDNGGFGREVVVEGWAASPDLPNLPDMDLNLGGITLMISE